MQINRPRADDAAAGQRNPRMAQAPEQRAEDADRTAHLADEFVVAVGFDLGGLHGQRAVGEMHPGPERGQDLAHEPHVAQVRHPVDDALFAGEEGRGHDGQHGVFRAADLHFAVQRHAAFDEQTFHEIRVVSARIVALFKEPAARSGFLGADCSQRRSLPQSTSRQKRFFPAPAPVRRQIRA